MEALISQGASVTVKDNITKRTPLHASGECELVLHLWCKPYDKGAVSFNYLLPLCMSLLDEKRRFWPVLRTAACLLRFYIYWTLCLSFLSLFFFPLWLWFSPPSCRIPSFPTQQLLCPYLLASTLSCLSLTTCALQWVMIPLWDLLSLNQNTRIRESTRLTAAPVEERLGIQVDCNWWWNYSCVPSIQPFAMATLTLASLELACQLALLGFCSIPHMQCA